MNEDKILEIEESLNKIKDIGAFLTSGNNTKANTMTITWANIGYMWKKKIFIIAISDIRYTKEFIDKENTFTISIPYDRNKDKALSFCGHNSGRNVDKIKFAHIKLDSGIFVDSPIVEGCHMYYECRVILKQKIDVNTINEELNLDKCEKQHTIYFGEIVGQYCNDDK